MALIGYAGAPWTIATYMVEGRGGGASEHAVVKQWALSDPDGFQPVIDVLTTAVTQFLERQIEAGAEAVQLFDTWAGILPDALFERWCARPVAAIIGALKVKHPDVPSLNAETGRILRALSGGPFVFNLGHGIAKTTPPEHVTALAEQVRSWTTPAPPDRLE